MKLSKSNRDLLAERICHRLMKRRGMPGKPPKCYRSVFQRYGELVSGRAAYREYRITMRVGPHTNRKDLYILIVHEMAHHVHHFLDGHGMPHGERFQRIFWGMLPAGLWKRAARGHWGRGRSAHKPQFQPDRPKARKY